MLWFVIRNCKNKTTKKIADLTRDVPNWESPATLAQWQYSCGSHIYCLMSTKSDHTYVGLIHDRAPEARWHEHTRNIKSSSERKYRKMKAVGLEQWYMLPLAGFKTEVESRKLHRVESIYINKFHKSLNKMTRHGPKRVPGNQRKVMALRQEDAVAHTSASIKERRQVKGGKQKQAPRRRCSHYLRWVEALDDQGKERDIDELVSKHTSMLINLDASVNKVKLKRSYGKTMVLCSYVYWRWGKLRAIGKPRVTTFEQALKCPGWIHLMILKRKVKYRKDDEIVREMESRLRQDTKHWYTLSSMTELWKMCNKLGKIRKDLRKKARLHLIAALRKKGLMTNPFKPMVVKAPSTASRKRTTDFIRLQLLRSTLPKLVARGIKVKVVKTKAQIGISILQNHKRHIKEMGKGALRCT